MTDTTWWKVVRFSKPLCWMLAWKEAALLAMSSTEMVLRPRAAAASEK